ncbi:MAG: amidase [Loktanella sp.]|nr:amidase [Loktanella sp.]
MKLHNELTATEALSEMDAGTLTAERLLRACFDRIDAREDVVGAFIHLDRDSALEMARRIDQSGRKGPMGGIPFAVKDIIDTHDMPTAYGSRIYAGHQPAADASCVALTRAAGGILVGKAVSTEFANFFPGKTANPIDPARTPGGSSSGSAAAVADCMVPLSLGTQTTQSTIRPAAFCGIYAYLPSQGDFRCSGVREAAGSFDRLGPMARSIEDLMLFRDVLLRIKPRPAGPVEDKAPKIGFCRTTLWDQMEPCMRAVMEEAVARLERAGAQITDITLPASFDGFSEAHRKVSSFEFVRNFAHEITHHWDEISEALRNGRIRHGLETDFEEYRAARRYLAQSRALIPEIFADVDVLITASAMGEAPLGLHATGSAAIGEIFTPLYLPCVSIPCGVGPNGMPLGLQVLAAADDDARLLAVSRWVDRHLN